MLRWVSGAPPNGTRAMLVYPTRPDQPYEIQGSRGQERGLSHLIVHEVGHIMRLYRVPAAERLAPIISQPCARQLLPALAAVVRLGLPPDALPALVNKWHQGVAAQIINIGSTV